MVNELNPKTIVWSARGDDLSTGPEDDIGQLRQKHKDELLRSVYDHDGISHAELADLLQVSASGLNAVLKKVCDVEKTPIVIQKVGKYKFYSLTNEGKQYVEANLLKQRQNTQERLEELWSLWIRRNPENPEEGFLSIFDNNALGKETENAAIAVEFLESFTSFWKEEKKHAWDMIQRITGSGRICSAVVRYTVEREHGAEVNERLNSQYEKNWKECFRIVDSVFAQITGDFAQIEDLEDGEAYENTFNAIVFWKARMLSFLVQHRSKIELRNEMIGCGVEEKLAYYIVEKYAMLQFKIYGRGNG